MTTRSIDMLTNLTDDQLVAEAKRLAADEQRATAGVVRVLMEFDARRLYLREGCSSLFVYCTQVLRLAEAAAYNRIEVARAARKYPEIVDELTKGNLNLTTVRLLAPHLTAENHGEVVAAARLRTRRQIEELIATLHRRPAVPASVRRLPPGKPVAPPSEEAAGERAAGRKVPAAVPAREEKPQATAASPAPRTAVVMPLAPERYKLQLTISRATHEKLRRAQDLLRHSVPSGDIAEILDRALTLLIEDVERRRLAATASSRGSRGCAPGSRHIPAAVKRAVWKRDGGRCAFVGRSGRCAETAFLEFHHVRPYAAGGEATEANISIRCRSHNGYEADLFFGGEYLREWPNAWPPAELVLEGVDAARTPGGPYNEDTPGWRNWQTLGT